MFAPETYRDRRHALAQQIGQGLILLPGHDESPMNFADNGYPFRQDSTFLYYFGIDRPGLTGLIDAESGESFLFGEDYSLDWIVWMGPQTQLAEYSRASGGLTVKDPGDLSAMLGSDRPVHYLPPYRAEVRLQMAAWLGKNPAEVTEGASEALIQAIVTQRSLKSDEEVAAIEAAVRITGEMHLTAMRTARPGMTEAEVMAKVYQAALAHGQHPSFPIILSVRGEVLHNHHYGNTLSEGDLLLCDAGAQSPGYYAGDMTRTFPVSDRFSTRQKEIYQIVLDALQAGVQTLRPGLPYRESHLKSALTIAQGLKALGLMKGDVEEAVAAGAHALFFPHGLGHMMGLDVHDMENLGEDYVGYTDAITRSSQFGLRSLRLGRELAPGFVLTVEPGIYFIPPLIDRWRADGTCADFLNFDRIETYKDFGGIRIEDDYLITRVGARLLGDPIPKSVAEVEDIRAEALS
ncbi:MAG: aminopeptidase P family protein [Bacteroidetes bacterium]|nr:MAG: aminopeptidase P family protein [Bacteroidota bacterium]